MCILETGAQVGRKTNKRRRKQTHTNIFMYLLLLPSIQILHTKKGDSTDDNNKNMGKMTMGKRKM